MLPQQTSTSTSPPSESFHYVDRDKIEEDLHCPICKNPLVDPVVHQPCDNTFCSKCIETCTMCPLCGKEDGDLMKECTVAHKIIRNQLDKLRVQCPICKNVMCRSELKDHQEKNCPLLEAYFEVEKKKQELDERYQNKVDAWMKQQEEFVLSEKEKLEQERLKMLKEVEEKNQENLQAIQLKQEELEQERKTIQQEKTSRYKLELSNKPIHLNIEGTVMTVSLSHFVDCEWEPNNLFKKMFSGEYPLYETPATAFQDKVFFIDCPLEIFELILGWLRYGGFVDNLDDATKYKLVQNCLYYDLENLTALLREKYFRGNQVLVSQSFQSIIYRKNGIGLSFNGLDFNGFSFGVCAELVKCKVNDCNLSNLKSGNKWIKTTFTRCNFSNSKVVIELSGCVFNSKVAIEFSDCTFTDCIFKKSNIVIDRNCSFKGCKMNGMDLSGTDLTKVQFSDIDFKGINFSNCKMGQLTTCNFVNCNFSQSNLMNGLSECVFSDCVLTGSKCVIEEECSFANCKMNNMELNATDFTKVVLHSGIDFTGSTINTNTKVMCNIAWVGCNFSNTTVEITLQSSKLVNCDFSKSKFNIGERCVLSECKMSETDLSGQDFTKVEFFNVDFTGSNLSNCKFGRRFICPIVTNCNLNGTSLISMFSILNNTQYLQITRLPLIAGKNAQLLFKASRDGFQARAFHSKCDGKSPTITFIKSENGYIFGGYTQAQWKSNGGCTPDDNAFIFTFKNGNELEVFKVKNPSNAIYNKGSHLITFGGGFDIHLCDQCNSKTNSYSNFGYSFNLPSGIAFGAEAKSYLAGSYNFKVTDVETYSL